MLIFKRLVSGLNEAKADEIGLSMQWFLENMASNGVACDREI